MIQAWDETKPDDNGLAGDGDDEIKGLKARVKERMELDHHFAGELDPLEGDCDGYHKKVTLQKLAEDPTPLTGTGVIYTKEVDGIIELFFVDEVSGVVNQLTEQGVLSLNTLQNDIDGNGKVIQNINMDYFIKRQRKVLTPFPAKPQFMFREIARTSNGTTIDETYWELEVKQACVVMISGGTNHSATQSTASEVGPFEIGVIKTGNLIGLTGSSGASILPAIPLDTVYKKSSLFTRAFPGLFEVDETYPYFGSANYGGNQVILAYLSGGTYYLKSTLKVVRDTGTARARFKGRVLYGYDPTANIDDIIVATQKGVGWS
jgi:hypothetical protein